MSSDPHGRPQDPAGVLPSNHHRRVLAHLPHPDDEYGWSPQQLVHRMGPDPDTDYTHANQIDQVLVELADDGLAELMPFGWRMTAHGFEKLNGPIADEPPPTPGVAQAPRRPWHARMLKPSK